MISTAARSRWQWQLGVPIYYQMMGKKLFGKGIKYPLARFAGVPESYLKRKLYLDLSDYKRTTELMPPFENEIIPAFETVKGLNMVEAAG